MFKKLISREAVQAIQDFAQKRLAEPIEPYDITIMQWYEDNYPHVKRSFLRATKKLNGELSKQGFEEMYFSISYKGINEAIERLISREPDPEKKIRLDMKNLDILFASYSILASKHEMDAMLLSPTKYNYGNVEAMNAYTRHYWHRIGCQVEENKADWEIPETAQFERTVAMRESRDYNERFAAGLRAIQALYVDLEQLINANILQDKQGLAEARNEASIYQKLFESWRRAPPIP